MAATGSSGEGRDGDGDGRDGDGRPRRGTRTAATQTKKKVIGFCFWVFVDRFLLMRDRVCLHIQYLRTVILLVVWDAPKISNCQLFNLYANFGTWE